MSFPTSFEKQLKLGKSWVYIPLRWYGSHKFWVLTVSKLLNLGFAITGCFLLANYTGKTNPYWIAGFILVFLVLANRLDAFFTHLRYRQQEDCYYSLYDTLRARLELEGKDYSEMQYRNLASYQHQQRLRKADETGIFTLSLRQKSHLQEGTLPAQEIVESNRES